MAQKKLVNSPTDQNVLEFIQAVENNRRKEDSLQLLALIQELTGHTPKIWGKSIIGFGKYSYQRKNGDEFEWFNVGFSPAKAHLSIYLMFDLTREPLLDQLGPHKKGKGCLYIKKLEEINLDILQQLILKSDKWEREAR